MRFRMTTLSVFFFVSIAGLASAQKQQPLASPQVWRDFINEASGDLALKDTAEIVRFDRRPGMVGFSKAAKFVEARARDYGLTDVRLESFPADGKIQYNTMRSEPAWSVKSAEVWITQPAREKLASYAEQNMNLGDFSRSADVTGELVDVGQGMTEDVYAKQDLKGKIILTSGPWDKVMEWGVRKRGAEGIIFYSPLSRGYSVNPRRIMWGGFFSPPEKGFVFILTYEKGSELARRLNAGEHLVLHASVQSEIGPGKYDVVTGIIPGVDREHEILIQAHLDHPYQSANDDAAGCAVLLDIARTWVKLIHEGRLAPPRRTVRFIWQAEMYGSMAYVARHPELPARILAGIGFGVIGGEIGKTKSLYHLYRSRASAPTFVDDLAEMMLEKVFGDSIWWMPTSPLPLRIQAATGSRDIFYSRVSPYFGGDDYTYDDDMTGFPLLRFNGAPDVNRHTSDDSIDKLDTTQMKRSSFLGLSVGYMAAMAANGDADWIADQVYTRVTARLAGELRQSLLHEAEAPSAELRYALRESLAMMDLSVDHERRALESIKKVVGSSPGLTYYLSELDHQKLQLRDVVLHEYRVRCERLGLVPGEPQDRPGTEPFRSIVPHRNPAVRGPMVHWFQNYLVEKLGSEIAENAAIYREPWWETTTTEILNFVDGKRSVLDVRDEVSAEFGQIPAAEVLEYLQLLKKADVVSW